MGVILIYLQAQHSLQKTQEGLTSPEKWNGYWGVLSFITKQGQFIMEENVELIPLFQPASCSLKWEEQAQEVEDGAPGQGRVGPLP